MPRRLGWSAASVLAAALLPAAPAAAGGDPCQATAKAYPGGAGSGLRRPPLIVADSSMMVGDEPLARLGFEADARGCRSFSASVDVIAARRRAGTLPRLVVIVAGANGGVQQGDVDRAVRIVGRRRMLGLVTSGGSAGAAAATRLAVRRHPRRTVLVDWAASGGPGRYGGDGIHIGVAGETELARLISRRTRPWQPPPRSLGVPRDAQRAKRCGPAGRVRVFVVVGRDRILCRRARELARAGRREPGWRWYAWRISGPPPWTEVYARRDGRVVVAVRPPLRS